MLTANNCMIKFIEKELSLARNRKELFDRFGREQAKIVFNHEKGIKIASI